MALRSAVVVTVVGAGILGWSVPAESESESRASCRGAKAQANHLELVGGKVSPRRVGCATGRTVVKRFTGRCVAAYTSQGSCRVKARKRFRCKSKLVGGPNSGALSAVSCVNGKARVGFRVRLSTEAIEIPPSGLAYPGAPYSETAKCIDTTAPGEAAPPPGAPNDGVVIRTTGSMPGVVAEAVQDELVSHNVVKRVFDGLGARPRQYPLLFPVFLRKGQDQGVTDFACTTKQLDGAVVEIGDSVDQAAQTAAHELFHAHSRGIVVAPGYPWFDDAAAEWSVWKAGLRNGPSPWEAQLQYPNTAVDALQPPGWKYAIWRFVQFLDDKGLVTNGTSWPLIRSVVATAPNLTAGLNQQLVARKTSLGQELNAFWAEHLKAKPKRPPRVVPTASNSVQERIAPGQQDYVVTAGNVHTKLVDFDVAEGVNRVEFVFEPVIDGHFSGLVAPNETRRFDPDGDVSFCIGAASGNNLEWPGHFAVVFTNGALGGGDVQGRLRVFAQTNAEQCGDPTNRACKLLRGAGVRGLLGPDLPDIPPFGGHKGRERGRPYTECAYKGRGGLGFAQVQRWPSGKALRKWIERKAKAPGWRSIKAGDAAIIFESPAGVFVQVAVGQERLTVEVSSDRGSTSLALRLAHELIPKL